MLRVCSLLFILILMLLVGGSAFGSKPAIPWSYEKLKSESDTIVIVKPIDTKTIGEKEVFFADSPDIYRQQVVTSFKVLDKLKGETGETIEVEHEEFRLYGKIDTKFFRGNVSFSQPSKDRRHYLLYLKKQKDNRYSFASPYNQFSVRELYLPSTDSKE